MNVTTKKIAEGKYEVRLDGRRVPCLIIGARKKYILEYYGESFPSGPFKTITSAASYAADLYTAEVQNATKRPQG